MMMDQEQPVYIAVIPPDTADASTTNFFPQHRSQPEFDYQSPSPNTSPGLSSEGYPPSPDTPSDGFQQDLAYAIQASSPSLDTLGLWDGGLSTSPSSLSPAFGFLNLTESSHQTGSDYGHTFGADDMSLKVDPTQQTRASLSPLTIPHNLNSPQPNQQLDSDEFFSFLNPEVDGSSLGVSSPYDNMVLLNPLSTPDDLVLHQHQRPSAHGRSNSEMNMPWSGSVSPSLVLTPSEPNSSASFLMPNHSFTEDYALAHVANLSRRHSAGATSGFPRGRSEGRSAPSSRGSSRGSSPYSRAGPALGPTGMSISPTQIFGDEINQQHLTVPGQHFEGGHSQGHQRRHSFTLGVRPESLVGEIFEMDPFYGNGSGEAQSPLTPTSTPTTPLTPSRTVAQVASPAGITASERRRTKAAKFACNQCPQTFTTNHNLKNHINAHNGVKKHACEFCTRAFTTASVLARHGKTCKAAPHHP